MSRPHAPFLDTARGAPTLPPNGGLRVGKPRGTRVGHRAYEQPAVRPALYRDLALASDPFADQIFARGDEVVKDVLFLVEAPGVVPRLAIFAAAAQVRDRQQPALVDPGEPGRRKGGSHRDVETAIAGKQRRRALAAVDPLLDRKGVGSGKRVCVSVDL